MGEFEGGDEARLLVPAEVADNVDDSVLFLERLIGSGIIGVVEGLFNLRRHYCRYHKTHTPQSGVWVSRSERVRIIFIYYCCCRKSSFVSLV